MKWIGHGILAGALCVGALNVQSPPEKISFKDVVIGRVFAHEGSGTCFPYKRIESPKGITPQIRDRILLGTARHVVRRVDFVRNKDGKLEEKEVLEATKLELYQSEKLIFSTNEVEVLRQDKDHDIAILEIKVKQNFEIPLLVLSKNSPVVGTQCFSFGCQAGMIPTFTHGYVCRPAGDSYKRYKDAWITSANVFGGASGGPVLDKYTGEVIGITSAHAMAIGGSGPLGPVSITVAHVHLFIDASKIRIWLDQ